MAPKSKRSWTPIVTDPVPQLPFCVDHNGSIGTRMSTTDGFSYRVAIYLSDPTRNPGAVATQSPVELDPVSNVYAASVYGGGGTYPALRWIQWSCVTNGSSYTSSYNISSCNAIGDGPVHAALSLALEPTVHAASSSASAQINRPTVLYYSHTRDNAWFSPPVDLNQAGDNAARWVLKMTGGDTWMLCLKRPSHEVAVYHHKTKGHNAQCFPLTFSRTRVSNDFKGWPATITVCPA